MRYPMKRVGLWGGIVLVGAGTMGWTDFSSGVGHTAARRATAAFGKAEVHRTPAPALPPCVPNTALDWMATLPADPGYQQINPPDCSELSYRTPTFNWPWVYGLSHELTWTDGAGRTRTVTTPANVNWYIPDTPLSPGRYSWTVRTSTNKLSAKRQFTILPTADHFDVPSPDEMVARAIATPHPRAFPRGAEKDALMAAIVGPRAAGIKLMANRATTRATQPLPAEPPLGSYHGTTQAITFAEEAAVLEALLVWKLLGRDDIRLDAKRRVNHLLTWNPDGATSHINHDQANRAIVWALTNYYDWAYPSLNPTERSQLLAMIKTRTQSAGTEPRILESLRNITKYPYDSHGFDAVARLASIGTMLAGDLPEANQWLKFAAPIYFNLHCPWGNEDGGYANGTNYGTWQAAHIINWQILRWVLGVDVRQKDWSKSYGKYIAYFLPKGAPSHLFGDGAEHSNGPIQIYGRAYVNHMRDPFYRWWANQFPVSSHVLEIFSPGDNNGPAFVPVDMGPSAHFKNIGWAAMHSSLTDPSRTSVYFKSSWYGSFSHSHADQNSFVLDSKGKRLLIDSGYYDDYNSPHWRGWYKLTKAHNAITFDGGQGQSISGSSTGDIDAKGNITQFNNDSPILDLVTGDATQSYKGSVTKAIRSMAYLRDANVVVVFDALASSAPRTWEWNLHSFNDMTVVSSPSQVQISTGTASVCVDMYSPSSYSFSKNNSFSVDPSPATDFPNQWHGRFSYNTPSLQGSFAAVLRVDCTPHTVSVAPSGADSWNILVDGVSLTFDGTTVRRD